MKENASRSRTSKSTGHVNYHSANSVRRLQTICAALSVFASSSSSSSSDDERVMSGGDDDEVECITYNKRKHSLTNRS